MSSSWAAFLDELKSSKGFVEADDLKKLIDEAQNDPLGFLMVQGEMLDMYLGQLADNEIDAVEFEASVRAIHDLIELESIKMSPEALARANGLKEGIEKLILGRLLPKITS
jgi:hypothetical protein